MSEGDIGDTGITLSEALTVVMAWIEDIKGEYMDDEKISAKEWVRLVGQLCERMGAVAEGWCARALNTAGTVLGAMAHIVPGAD